jgi:small subunit ribosomal protein S1
MVHLSDLDWKRPGEQVIEEYKKGDKVRAKVLDVDVEKERISLGIKQLEGDPMDTAGDIKKGSVVTCEIIEVKEAGIDVKIVGTDLTTFIKRAELAAGPRRAADGALRRRREGRCADHPVRPPRPQGAGVDQGA